MKTKGFTLIELMITLSILAIVMAIAFPSFSSLLTKQKIKSKRDELMSAFQYARTEAVTRNRSVSICPSTDPWGSSPACSESTDWSTGWIVFYDSSGATTPSITTILRSYPQTEGMNVKFNSTGAASSNLIRYVATGMMDTVFNPGTFEFSDPENAVATRSVIISPTTGQARIGS
jgi:type IV fimbrial biogenesis protein FimT